MKRFLLFLGLLLFLLHQDFWWWGDTTLVFGFLPIGLAYHTLFSFLAAGLWALMVKFAWPHKWEQWAGQDTAGDDA